MRLFSLPSRKTSSYVQNTSNISFLFLIFTITVGFCLQIQALHKLCLHFTHLTAAGHNHEWVCKSHVLLCLGLLCPTSCTTPEASPTSFWAAPQQRCICHSIPLPSPITLRVCVSSCILPGKEVVPALGSTVRGVQPTEFKAWEA